MKKIIFLIFAFLIIQVFCSCKKEKNTTVDNKIERYIEPSEESIVEFCRRYYKESSKVHAKSLMIYDIDDLDEYYINHEVEKGPSEVDTSSIYIKSDDFDLIEVEKEKINYSIDIGEKKEYITFSYTVYFYYNYYGTINNPIKEEKHQSGYTVYAYGDKLKISIDPSLTRLSVCKSDVPIALQSLKEGKVIKFR